jgi:signal transduction histidine kinase
MVALPLPADNIHLTDEVLGKNTTNNHYRILVAASVVIVLILIATALVEAAGITTPAINYPNLMYGFLFCALIQTILAVIVRYYGAKNWTKWLVVTGLFLNMTFLRAISCDAPENLAVYYLVIVMALFYFDIPLIVYSTLLAIGGDVFLTRIYPELLPATYVTIQLIMRYLTFVWVGIAAAIGSRATADLIYYTVKLKSANVRLQEDIERKDRLEGARNDFFAVVSHELRSPISLIKGYAEGIKDGIASEKEREYFVDVIIDEAEKMNRLVSDMMDVSLLETGFLQLEKENFYLDKMITVLGKRFNTTIKEKNLIFDTYLPNEHLLVSGDPYRIEHVLSNFINNAIRYTPNGYTISITAKRKGESVQVSVENQGSGIQTEYLQRIWEPFFRLEKSRNRNYGGTGLGLSVARTILLLHESDFGAINTDTGVCFYFTLPLANADKLPV